MKNKMRISAITIIVFSAFLWYGCRDKVYRSYEANIPIVISEENWRSIEFQLNSSKNLSKPGKIYIKDQYLFVNEFMEGIHIIDNSDPSNPVNLGFLDILANVDMAVKGNILYADSYFDLLSFDISDPGNPFLVDRDTNLFNFNNVISMSGYNEDLPIADYYAEKGIVVGWEQKVVSIEDESQTRGGYYETYMDAGINMEVLSSGGSNGISSTTSGIGGSMARFTVFADNLYTLQDWMLSIYDISNSSDPVHVKNMDLDRQAETLFPTLDHLFIGTTTGMMIYNLSNPSSPTYVSTFAHITSCDPVYVYENKAYVTLSSGTRCWNDVNRLDVIDVQNLSNPQLLKTYAMTNPKGLSIDNNTLFLCDGSDGLKIFDITDTYAIAENMIHHFPEIDTYDVIAYNNVLIMVGNDGIYQYDYSDLNNIVELSVINITE